MEKLVFPFRGMPVGTLEELRFPAGAGRFRYMPYRGPGHFDMCEAVKNKGTARCTFEQDGQPFDMVVDGIPEYGVLSVATVRQVSSQV